MRLSVGSGRCCHFPGEPPNCHRDDGIVFLSSHVRVCVCVLKRNENTRALPFGVPHASPVCKDQQGLGVHCTPVAVLGAGGGQAGGREHDPPMAHSVDLVRHHHWCLVIYKNWVRPCNRAVRDIP